MKSKVLDTINRYAMLKEGDRVVVGVSGGADSISLLHILKSLESELQIIVSAIHIDHGLRGDESDRDREFTSAFCQEINVPLTVVCTDIAALSKESGKGLEETGRDFRYAEFSKAAGERGIIATAHTLSDSVETLIFNLVRGASLKGLCSIPPVRDNIIRPLIECTRSEVEKYIEDNSLEYVDDSSNFKCDYSRNLIRLNVIPELRKINPSVEKTIGRTVDSMRKTYAYIDSATDDFMKKSKNDTGLAVCQLKNCDDVIRTMVLKKWLSDYDIENAQLLLIDEIIRKGNGAVTVAPNTFVRVEGGYLVVSSVVTENDKEEFSLPCNFNECLLPNGKKVRFKIISRDTFLERQKINNLFVNNCIDYDKIDFNVTIRNRKNGDSFRQANRNCGKSLKKLFNEKKIPVEKRAELVILESDGEVIWIENFGSCERTKVEESTRNILWIEIGV